MIGRKGSRQKRGRDCARHQARINTPQSDDIYSGHCWRLGTISFLDYQAHTLGAELLLWDEGEARSEEKIGRIASCVSRTRLLDCSDLVDYPPSKARRFFVWSRVNHHINQVNHTTHHETFHGRSSFTIYHSPFIISQSSNIRKQTSCLVTFTFLRLGQVM